MRYAFVEVFNKIAQRDKKVIFLTGDLGFNLFEPLKKNLGKRFINAGVAEQNMVTVAAGLAYVGFKPWIYSITPFVTIKVLEQLRNDICFPNFNVKIVGLGGGYDYEVAGPSHHAIEDVGILSALPNMHVYTPAFAEDVETVVKKIYLLKGPAYLRLAKARKISVSAKKYADCRRIIQGEKISLVALGTIIDKSVEVALSLNRKKPVVDLWSVCKLPVAPADELVASIKKTGCLAVVEEHVANGGLGQFLSRYLHINNIPINKFIHFYAKGYPSKYTGSRDFYLRESGLDKKNIERILRKSI